MFFTVLTEKKNVTRIDKNEEQIIQNIFYRLQFIDSSRFIASVLSNLVNNLSMEDINDADYAHAKRVCKDFEMKNSGEYHDLYVQSDALFLVDVFENFRNMCLKIYELDLAHFLTPPG